MSVKMSSICISASKSGHVLQGKEDGRVCLWELNKEQPRSLKAITDFQCSRPISTVRISIGGNYGIIGDDSGTVQLTQLQSPQKTSFAPTFKDTNRVIGVDFADLSTLVLCSTSNETFLWDFRNKSVNKVHQYGIIKRCKIDKSGVSLALNTEEGFLSIWDVRAMKSSVFMQGDMLSSTTAVNFSSNGLYLACGYRNGNVIVRDRSKNWSIIKEFSPVPHPISSVTFSECNKYIYTGSHGCISRACTQVETQVESRHKMHMLNDWSDSFVSEMSILRQESELAVFSHKPDMKSDLIDLNNEVIWTGKNVEGTIEKELKNEPRSQEPLFKIPRPVEKSIEKADEYNSKLNWLTCLGEG